MTALERLAGRCDAHHAGRNLVRAEEREVEFAAPDERSRTDVFRHLAACHLDFPVQQAAWHAGARDRRLAERPPRLGRAAVRTVEHVGAGRIGVDVAHVREIAAHLFCEEWIVRDVWLRLLREPVRIVELLGPGEPDDLGQRLLPRPADLRVALRPPCDASGGDGERDDRGRNPPAARRPRPRDRGRCPTTTAAHDTQPQDRARRGCRDRAPLAVAHERSVDDVFQLRGDVWPQCPDRRGVAVSTAWMIASALVPLNGGRPASIS